MKVYAQILVTPFAKKAPVTLATFTTHSALLVQQAVVEMLTFNLFVIQTVKYVTKVIAEIPAKRPANHALTANVSTNAIPHVNFVTTVVDANLTAIPLIVRHAIPLENVRKTVQFAKDAAMVNALHQGATPVSAKNLTVIIVASQAVIAPNAKHAPAKATVQLHAGLAVPSAKSAKKQVLDPAYSLAKILAHLATTA